MICMFCANKNQCFGEMITDEELLKKDILCNYDNYELADNIGVEDLIEESYRRFDENNRKQEETA